METRILPADEPTALDQAVALVQAGQVIAAPTDTVYGLVCRVDDPQAIRRLYAVKERPPEKALPVLLAGEEQLPQVVAALPEPARLLMARFWPGPLTLVLPARPELPRVLTGNGATVAVRVPDHPFLRALARRAGPLASSSANRSGQPPARTAQEVLAQLAGRIPLVVDGGEAPGGVASTVVDVTGPAPRLLREGPVAEQVRALLAQEAEQSPAEDGP